MSFLDTRIDGKLLRSMWPFGRGKPEARSITQHPVSAQEVARASRSSLSRFVNRYDRYVGSSFFPATEVHDLATKQSLVQVRRESRTLERRNEYVRNAVRIIVDNVLGTGVALQSRAEGELAARVEAAWKEWGMRGNCDVTGKHSWRDVERIVANSLVEDGEAIVVARSGGIHNFQVQLVDAARLDHNKNDRDTIMGVRMDAVGKPTGYYLYNRPLALAGYPGLGSDTSSLVRADSVAHIFHQRFAEQTRGMPWLQATLDKWPKIAKYEDAELGAAILSAIHLGFLRDEPEALRHENDIGGNAAEVDDKGRINIETDDGGVHIEDISGKQFTPWDNPHPQRNFPDFLKALLRSASSGMGVPYNALGNNFEDYNFSSSRAEMLVYQDVWKDYQRVIIEGLHEWVFAKWLLEWALVEGVAAPEQIAPHQFVPRTWQHVQPREQARANEIDVGLGVKSRSRIMRENGIDPDEEIEEMAAEQQKLDAAGVQLPSIPEPDAEETATDAAAAQGEQSAKPVLLKGGTAS